MVKPTDTSRRRILYMAASSRWNGGNVYLHRIALHAARLNFDVLVAAPGQETLAGECIRSDIPFHELSGACDVLRIFFRFRPHILHVADARSAMVGGWVFFLYRILLLRFNSSNVYTMRGWTFPAHRAQHSRWQEQRERWLAKLRCWLFDSVILMSRADSGIALEYRILPKRKTSVIAAGIESSLLLPQSEARERLLEHSARDRVIIGTVGEFTRAGGHRHLLEAFASLKHAFRERHARRPFPLYLLLIGRGDAERELEEKIDALKIEGDVAIVANAVPARPYLSAIDIFVWPSLDRRLPFALLEAADAGLPVIATDAGGNTEIIRHEKTGLIVPAGNAGKIAAALERYLKYPAFANECGERLREYVQKNFSERAMLEKTFELY